MPGQGGSPPKTTRGRSSCLDKLYGRVTRGSDSLVGVPTGDASCLAYTLGMLRISTTFSHRSAPLAPRPSSIETLPQTNPCHYICLAFSHRAPRPSPLDRLAHRAVGLSCLTLIIGRDRELRFRDTIIPLPYVAQVNEDTVLNGLLNRWNGTDFSEDTNHDGDMYARTRLMLSAVGRAATSAAGRALTSTAGCIAACTTLIRPPWLNEPACCTVMAMQTPGTTTCGTAACSAPSSPR